jgi:tRNA pseudouridine 55 synthase
MDGFLIIDKPLGPSSQKIVSGIKRALQVKKAGHTGTLDPLATGVLPLALGEATKVISYLDEREKTYQVEGLLGLATTTYDAEGDITHEADPSAVSCEMLRDCLAGFLGEQSQTPPPYSAVKIQGRPLYRYARAGQQISPAPRTVIFCRLDLLSFDSPRFKVEVVCGRGTYVRSLVHDLGAMLGCGAHVTQLRRTATGIFHLGQALGYEDCLADPIGARDHILSIERCLSDLPQLNLESDREAEMVRAGVPLHRIGEWFGQNDRVERPVLLKYCDRVLAIVQAQPGGGFRFQRVLQGLKNPGL